HPDLRSYPPRRSRALTVKHNETTGLTCFFSPLSVPTPPFLFFAFLSSLRSLIPSLFFLSLFLSSSAFLFPFLSSPVFCFPVTFHLISSPQPFVPSPLHSSPLLSSSAQR